MENHWYIENRRGKYCSQIKEERRNFLFLKDGSMVVPPYPSFDSYIDAMIDAVVNYNEDLDDLISLVFPEKIDHPIVKKKLLPMIKEYENKLSKNKKDI